jgi:hypothetical protein
MSVSAVRHLDSRLSLSEHSGHAGMGRIDEHRDMSGQRHQFTQEFQPLCRQLL